MAKYPKSVIVNETHLADLTQTYEQAFIDIYSEIANSTNFGVANRRRILASIEKSLQELGVDTTKFIEENIPDYYKMGADDAVSQLKAIYAPVEIKTGFNVLHREAIAALVSDTARAFGESIGQVNRSAKQLMSVATKESITQKLATGQISGEALRKTKEQVIGQLQSQGLYALVDRGGNGWTLDRYSEMLIRTKMVEARNTGLVNRMVENNYDLVQVSEHGATDICGDYEGKIYSITGQTPGYPKLSDIVSIPTAGVKKGKPGLFHPNCKHAINALTLDLARQTMHWNAKTREYEKGIIE